MESIKYFFSYSRNDSDFVIKLATDLKNEGLNAWLDQLDIPPGARWDAAVEQALNEAECMLVVLSDTSVKSENVLDEVSYAINKGKKVIPLVIDNCEVPFRMARFQRIDFTRDYNTGYQQLLKALKVKPTHQVTNYVPVQKEPEAYPSETKPKRNLLVPILLVSLAIVSIVLLSVLFNSKDASPESDNNLNTKGDTGNSKIILRDTPNYTKTGKDTPLTSRPSDNKIKGKDRRERTTQSTTGKKPETSQPGNTSGTVSESPGTTGKKPENAPSGNTSGTVSEPSGTTGKKPENPQPGNTSDTVSEPPGTTGKQPENAPSSNTSGTVSEPPIEDPILDTPTKKSE